MANDVLRFVGQNQLMLWLLLLRHSAKSLNAQKERLATSHLLVTRLHAIVVRLRKISVIIIVPETAGTVGV